MKKIVTHINPDLDAIASAWLLKRFLLGWEEAEIDFIRADKNDNSQADKNNDDILYVDVGGGKLDHHQINEHISATKLCWDYIQGKRANEKLGQLEEKAITRLVDVVTQVDNADDLSWPESKNDRFQFYLHNLIDGWRELSLGNMEVVEEGFRMLDAILLLLKNKLKAEEEITKATVFKTKWGKGICFETGNKHFLNLAIVLGYQVAFIKNPKNGGVRIHARPNSKVDFTGIYKKIRKLDPQSDWFLHSSKKLLLNMASVAQMRPTKLTLKQIIEILQKG